MADKVKKPNIFVRLGRHISKSWSELKKVSWPTFAEVVKNTGIVLVVVVAFMIIIGGFDTLFGYLLKLLLGTGA
ncbi:MAG: preprotein translocase subunit SecE [Clostridia bacterium]